MCPTDHTATGDEDPPDPAATPDAPPAVVAHRRATASREPPAVPLLNDRERQVLTRVADGMTGADVADELYLSQATVERHVSSGLRKLGARNRAHGIAIALRTGELARPDAERGSGWTDGEQALAALLEQTLEGLEDASAVLDAQGDVLMVNEAWRALRRAEGGPPGPGAEDYVGACDRAVGRDDARRAAWG